MSVEQLDLLAPAEPSRDNLREWAVTYVRQLGMPRYLRDDQRSLGDLTDRELFALPNRYTPSEVAQAMVAEAADLGREGAHLGFDTCSRQ